MAKTQDLSMFHTRYNKPIHQGLICKEPTLTQQSFANDVDINEIVAKYTKSQLIENHNLKDIPENYKEYSQFDYSDSMDKIAKIKEDFESLPASIRSEYDNDPSYWYDSEIKRQLQEFENQSTMIEEEIKKEETVETTATLAETTPPVGGA